MKLKSKIGKIGCLSLSNAPIGASNQQKTLSQFTAVFLFVRRQMDLTCCKKQSRSAFAALGQHKLIPQV